MPIDQINAPEFAPAKTPIRAAIYVRMSTEHQQYSTSNQEDVIRDYALRRGFEIVRIYADEGKSGLNVAGRAALQQMIADVQSGAADYEAILAYDISRWGRFQDADESAYYEYLCKRAGLTVHYCAEQFENDGGPASTIIKSVKRAMAGEYSRELSTKVFKGQCRLIELGYRQGGPAGFGLRRMLLNQSGEQKGALSPGERKSLQTDRVILVPGPESEIYIVQSIYDQFIRQGKRELEIAQQLNAQGIVTDFGRPWTKSTVHQVLTNEKYIGHNVYNRRSFKLKKKRVDNPPDMWVRRESAFEPIVAIEDFFTARGIIQERFRRVSDAEMLDKLRELAAKTDRLSAHFIDSCDELPSSSAYRSRFGSLLKVYQLIGHQSDRDYSYVESNKEIRALYPKLESDLIAKFAACGATVCRDRSSELLLVNGEYSASLVLSRCRQTAAGAPRWLVNLDRRVSPDITILVRMDASNRQPADFYLFPILDIERTRFLLCEANGVFLDTYQFESIDYLASISSPQLVGA